MEITPIGSDITSAPEVNQDSFTKVSGIEESSPSQIEPMIQKFDNAGLDTVNIDSSGDLESQKDITNLSLSVRNNFGQPMDQAAKLLKLEMDTGLPSEYIKQNMGEVEKESHLQNFSVENFRESNPKFAKWVAENPNHYSLVKDDLNKFRDIEDQTSFMTGFSNAKLQAEKSGIIGKRIRDEATPADLKREAEIDQLMQEQGEKSKDESFGQMITRTGGYASYQIGQSTGAAVTGAAVGAVAALPTGGLSIGAGAKIGAMTANTLAAYEMETNFAYDDLTKITDKSGNKMDKESALNVARGIGALNAAIETAGDLIFLKMVPGGQALLGTATKTARKTMTELATKALAKPELSKMLLNSAKMIAQGSISEGATEFIQSLVGATGTRAAIAIDGNINPESSWKEDLSQGALEGKEAFFGSVFTLGLMHGTSNSYSHIKKIQAGEENAKFYKAVADGVQSKSFQALPEKGQEAVRAAIAGGANETTYFQSDSWDAYWKAKGVDPREAAAQVAGDGGKAYDQAFDAGGHIAIKTDQMGAKLLANDDHKELLLDATTDPNKETPREAMKAREEMQAEIDAVKSNVQKDSTKISEVEQKVYEQLKAANDPGDARKKAKLFSAINEQLAHGAGVTPEEFYAKYGLNISRILPERLNDKNINELDPLIERIRSGDIPSESQARGKSLTEFLREKGGINNVGQGSDIASFEADKSMKGFKRLSNKKSGMDVDRAAILAHESGYISNPDTRELIDAVSKDIGGNPIYSSQNENSNLSSEIILLNEFKKHLDSLGVDVSKHDNAMIKKMLSENRANPEANDNIFLQSPALKNLIITHNLSSENLKHADKLGGLAVPSLAITNANSPLANFGEITLLGSKEMADPKSGTKVFGADIYSPRYPKVSYDFSRKDFDKLNKELDPYFKMTGTYELDKSSIESGGSKELENNSALMAKFLESKEIKPKIIFNKSDSKKIKEFQKAGFSEEMKREDYYNLFDDPKFVDKALKYYIDFFTNVAPDKDAVKELKNKKKYGENGTIGINLVRSLARDLSDLGKNAKGDKIDVYPTRDSLKKQIESKKLKAEYSEFVSELFNNKLKPTESIFAGQKSNGENKYVEHNIDNVISIMRKNLRGGENFNYGVGSIRAMFTPEFSSVKAIKDKSQKLVTEEEFENIKDEINSELEELTKKLNTGEKSGSFDGVSTLLVDSASMGLDRALTENGYKNVSDEVKEEVRVFIEKLKELPTAYFEAKILRTVRLNEFSGAVIPNDTSEEVRQILKKSGVKVLEYKGDEKNTDKSLKNRVDAIQKLAESLHGEGVNTYFQGAKKEASPQGRIRISANRTMNIDLYKTANFSTFLHEQGHYWLEVMGDISESPTGSQRIKDMYAETLKYLGVENRSQIETKHHEMFAESFEKYLMEGKAPTTKLQEMFNTFKAWMQWVYTSLKGLQVELSPEIRSVFDRMIASDEEISKSKNEMVMEPMILDPHLSGMTEAQAEKYNKLFEEARTEASNALTVKMMKQIQRERSSAWKAERQEVKEQMTNEVDGQFDQILMKALKSGELPSAGLTGLKLDKKSVIAAYGKEFADKLPRSIFSKDGQEHNALASMLGFDNGWQMIELIANAQDRNALIEQKTNDEMLARHGAEDIYTNGKLHEEALTAVHNDKQAELMRMEMDWLMQHKTKDAKGIIKSIARRTPTIEEARAKAEYQINQMQISSIKAYQFLRSEKKHANEAVDHMLKGNFDAAYESKKKQILNHELYRAAVNAQEDIDKIEGRLNKFFQEDSKLGKNRDMHLIGAGRAILAGFGFSNDPRSPEQHLEQIKKYDPAGYELIKGRIDTALENADYYTNLSYEKFTALADLLDGLWSQSKSEKLIEIDGQKVDIGIALEALGEGLSKLPKYNVKNDKYANFDRTATDDDVNLNGFQVLKSRMTRLEFKVDSMDSFAGGMFRTYIFNPIRQATEKYRTKKGEVTIKLNEIMKAHESSFGGPEIVAENLNFVFKNKSELLGAMLHIGTESNFKKLILGNEWGVKREDGSLDSSRWDEFIQKCESNGTLHASDYKFLESIWDLLDSFKGDTQRAHKEMNGFYFSEIRGRSVESSFGTFKGGYVPATADKMRSRDPQIRNEKAMIEDNFHSELPQKLDGFSKARIENYSTPLIMDISLITSHIDNALRYTYITPRVKEVMKLVHNREMRNQFDNYDPSFVSHVVIPFLQRATTQSTTVATQNKQADKFFSFAKNNQAIQLMFMNIPNTVQQFANFIPATLKASPIHLLNAIKETTLHSKDIEQAITNKSAFMKNHIETLSERAAIETQNILEDRGSFERGSVWLAKNAYLAQIYLQNIMNKQVWLASYDQAITDGMDEKQAIEYADSAIRSTQGSYAAEDTAAIETNTPLMKTLMMFYGFFNNMGNLYVSEWNKAGSLDGGKREIKKAMIVANYFLFAFAGKLTIDAVRGQVGKPEDDKDSIEFWLKYFFGASFELAAPMAGVPGQLAYAGYKNLMGESSYNDRISVSPLISSAEQLAKGVKNIVKDGGSKKTMTKDVMTLMADTPLMGFIPIKGLSVLQKGAGYSAAIGALKRPVGYAVGVNEGKDSAETPMNVVQGIVAGSSRK